MRLPPDVLLRHLWVLGMTGAGKSTAMLSWIYELLRMNIAVALIDPNSDLWTDTVNRLPYLPKRIRERAIIWDPLHPTHAIPFNPLEVAEGEEVVRVARHLATVFTKLFAAEELITVLMQMVMFHSFWLLARMKLTLLELPRLLTDRAYRTTLLPKLPPEDYDLLLFWTKIFPLNERQVVEWTRSTLARILPFTPDPALKRIFGCQKSAFSFRWVMDEQIPLFVNLRMGTLGSMPARLFGAFIVAQFELAALSREREERDARHPYLLFIDECQNVLTDDIEVILTQARKYGLCLIAANQHYEQLRDFPKLQSAFLNTVGNWALFRTGAADSELLTPDTFRVKVDVVKDIHIRKNPTGISFWPYETVEDRVWRPLDEIRHLYQTKLTDLNDFEFYFRQRGKRSTKKLRVVRLPSIRKNERHQIIVEQLIAASVTRYGKPHGEIDREIVTRQQIDDRANPANIPDED